MRKTLVGLVALPLLLSACSQGPRYCPRCGYDLQHNTEEQKVLAPTVPTLPQQQSASQTHKMSAAAMFAKVQEVIAAPPLDLKVASADKGVVITDWKDFPGEMHLIRRWDERSRFRIAVIPDISDPANACRIEVSTETERRSNSQAHWEFAGARPDRTVEITKQIESKL